MTYSERVSKRTAAMIVRIHMGLTTPRLQEVARDHSHSVVRTKAKEVLRRRAVNHHRLEVLVRQRYIRESGDTRLLEKH